MGKKLLLLISFLLMIIVCDIVYICTGSSMRMVSKPQYSLILESLLTQEHSVWINFQAFLYIYGSVGGIAKTRVRVTPRVRVRVEVEVEGKGKVEGEGGGWG